MLASRQPLAWMALALAALATAPGAASAQGKLDARYSVTLAGIPIGEGSWLIDISDSEYSTSVSGATVGLMRALFGGRGNSATRGTLQAGAPMVSTYAATIESSKKTDRIRITVDGGNVKELKVEPPVDADAERVPMTEDAKKGVLDPLTASLVRTPGNGNPLRPEACQRTVAVFDGKLRYDLQLAYKRMDKVKADKGYDGPVVVCAVYFSPVAGHVPSRAAIKYVSRQRDMEVWLAPIAGTRVLVPFRIEGPTPVGPAVLEATQFVSVALPPKEAKGPVIKTNDKAPEKAATGQKTP